MIFNGPDVYSYYTIVTQFGKTTLVAYNNFEKMLTFKLLLFGHFAQKGNEIWCPRGPVNAPSRCQI